MSMFEGIQRWDLILMFVLLGVIFTFELLGVFMPQFVTITQIIKAYIPMPVRWLVFGWMFWHFIGSDLWPVRIA